MTDAQKEQVRYLRCEGLGYGAIATRLGISENTVKSFCRRNNLTGVASKEPVVVCRNCGRPLPQYPKRKQRKFCSEACRRAWWKLHPELIHKAAFYPATCAHCGQEFQSYGNRKRKYLGVIHYGNSTTTDRVHRYQVSHAPGRTFHPLPRSRCGPGEAAGRTGLGPKRREDSRIT